MKPFFKYTRAILRKAMKDMESVTSIELLKMLEPDIDRPCLKTMNIIRILYEKHSVSDFPKYLYEEVEQ